MTIAPAPRPAYEPGVDFYNGDLVQMLGLPSRLVREDDVARSDKYWRCCRCARRIDKDRSVLNMPAIAWLPVLRDSMAIARFRCCRRTSAA